MSVPIALLEWIVAAGLASLVAVIIVALVVVIRDEFF